MLARGRFAGVVAVALAFAGVAPTYGQQSSEYQRYAYNGHWYQAVSVPGSISWSDAKLAAESRGGYLATITSADENSAVFTLVNGSDSSEYWFRPGQGTPRESPHLYGPWLGGFQPPGSDEPGGKWQWVTRETWGFSNWSPGEPNNCSWPDQTGSEDKLHFHAPYSQVPLPTWNDYLNSFEREPPEYGPEQPIAYIVEYDSNPVPEPSTLLVSSWLGAVGLSVGWWRWKRGA